jgi:hypothetical protein
VADTIAEPPAVEPSTAELEKRIAELEAENARLSASAGGSGTDIEATGKAKGGGWRAFLSALCIVIAAILVPVSIVAAWARSELVDEETFVATLAPLAQNSHVQDLIVTEAMDAIDSKVDFNKLTGNVIDGIASLGLSPRATNALRLLQQPAADGLHNLVQTSITDVVQSPQFADVWATAVRGAHNALVTTATSDNTGNFVLTDQGLGLKLGPIVDQVKQKLVAAGVGAASLIPSIDKTIIIGDGSAVGTIRAVYSIAVTVGLWLPLFTLALFAAGILIARRRSTAVLGTGIALFLGGAALASTFSVGTLVVDQAASRLKLSVSALDVVYNALIENMNRTALIAALLGALIAVVGWVTGRWTPARRIRGLVGGLNASARTALAARGMDTGGFGEWMGRQRILVRTILVVLAIVWLILLRPLSTGDVFLVVIVTLLVTWALELLQKRPDDAARAEAGRVAEDETLERAAAAEPAVAAEHATVAAEPAVATATSGARESSTAAAAGAETPAEASPDAVTAVIPDADTVDTAEIPDGPPQGPTKK